MQINPAGFNPPSDSCRPLCDRTKNCVGLLWRTVDNRCWIWRGWAFGKGRGVKVTPNGALADHDVQLRTPKRIVTCPGPVTWKEWKDYVTYQIVVLTPKGWDGVTATGPNDCAKYCKGVSCEGFTYRASDKKCWAWKKTRTLLPWGRYAIRTKPGDSTSLFLKQCAWPVQKSANYKAELHRQAARDRMASRLKGAVGGNAGRRRSCYPHCGGGVRPRPSAQRRRRWRPLANPTIKLRRRRANSRFTRKLW